MSSLLRHKMQMNHGGSPMEVRKTLHSHILFAALLTAFLGFSYAVQAQQDWKATVGGQSADMSKQAVAFLPNELWIHAGDSITWTFASGDIHTVTFLTVGQVYPFDQSLGCPPVTPSGLPFDGSSCVSSAPLTLGQTYQVIFPTAGNYEIVCLVHGQMFGTIHVLDTTLPLPHDQAYYDKQAKQQLQALLRRRGPPAAACTTSQLDREHVLRQDYASNRSRDRRCRRDRRHGRRTAVVFPGALR